MEQQPKETVIIRLPEVMRRTGLGRSSIYKGMNGGIFPKCIKISLRAVGWVEHEIEAWISERCQSNVR